MRTRPALLNGLPLPLRGALLGAACAGLLGAGVGLVVGLRTYLPSAVFAMVEVGALQRWPGPSSD